MTQAPREMTIVDAYGDIGDAGANQGHACVQACMCSTLTIAIGSKSWSPTKEDCERDEDGVAKPEDQRRPGMCGDPSTLDTGVYRQCGSSELGSLALLRSCGNPERLRFGGFVFEGWLVQGWAPAARPRLRLAVAVQAR
jgi:hypothetical protein